MKKSSLPLEGRINKKVKPSPQGEGGPLAVDEVSI